MGELSYIGDMPYILEHRKALRVTQAPFTVYFVNKERTYFFDKFSVFSSISNILVLSNLPLPAGIKFSMN